MLAGFAKVYSSVALYTDWSKTSAHSSVKVLGESSPFVFINMALASSAVRVSAGATLEDWNNDRILDMVVLAITSNDPLLYINYDRVAATESIRVPVESSASAANADRSKMAITDDLVTISKYYSVADNNDKSMETTNPLAQDEMIRVIN